MSSFSASAVSPQADSGMPADAAPLPPTPRRSIGCSKSGLSVSLEERPGYLALRGRADPLLLYLAIGGALGLGLLASILRSPTQGFISSFVFSALFSPLLIFLIYSTLRLRTDCVINRVEGTVSVSERSYRTKTNLTLPVSSLTAIVVAARSQMPVVGGPETHSLYLDADELRYLVLVGYDEGAVRRVAERLSEQLKLPLLFTDGDDGSDGLPRRGKVLATTAVLYLAPTLLGIATVYLAFPGVSVADRLMLTSLGAIILSQLGAILAFAYYRGREPRGTRMA